MRKNARRGIVLDDRPTQPALIERHAPLRVWLTQSDARFHLVKRMVAALGSAVLQP